MVSVDKHYSVCGCGGKAELVGITSDPTENDEVDSKHLMLGYKCETCEEEFHNIYKFQYAS